MTEYGRQKAEAEAHLQKLKPRTAIVRLGKVIHPDLRLFQEWMAALRANQPVRAYSDYFCSPAPVELAARAIARIAELRAPGIWHVSAHDQLSYAEIARHFARRLGRDEALVQAGPAPAGLMEHLPMHTSLDSARTVDLLGSPAFDSRSALDEVLFAPRSVWAAPRGVGEGVL